MRDLVIVATNRNDNVTPIETIDAIKKAGLRISVRINPAADFLRPYPNQAQFTALLVSANGRCWKNKQKQQSVSSRVARK